MDNPSLHDHRGALEAQEPGARGLEHMARNGACVRLAALTLASVSPTQASEQVYGRPGTEGLSPFAIRRGERFEEALFAEQSTRLLQMYRAAGRLSASEERVTDMSLTYPADRLAERAQASRQLIVDRAIGKPDLPNVIIKPRLWIEVLGHQHPCEPDALVAADQDRTWRIVEIKSYADRLSLTDAVKTGSACRQAAVGVLALRQALTDANLDPLLVEPLADLIFARPGTNWPSLNLMQLHGELENIGVTLSEAPALAAQALQILGQRALDDRQALEALPNRPCSGCADHCPLWEDCRGPVLDQGLPALLGDEAHELMAQVSSLSEAVALREAGQHADPDLNLLAGLLHDCDQAYQEARP